MVISEQHGQLVGVLNARVKQLLLQELDGGLVARASDLDPRFAFLSRQSMMADRRIEQLRKAQGYLSNVLVPLVEQYAPEYKGQVVQCKGELESALASVLLPSRGTNLIYHDNFNFKAVEAAAYA